MLKRQRQQSPPPSSGSIPLVPDSVTDTTAAPNFKRRRTAPPLLDGVSRGWTQRDEDEGGFDLDDYEDFTAPTPQGGPSSEYSATNSLLRDLHTLNQHRLLFSSPEEKSHRPSSSGLKHVYYPPHSPTQGVAPLPISKAETHSMDSSPRITRIDPICSSHPPVGDEMIHVMKRYEGTNRYAPLVGSSQ
jgi:hypothetical protein